MRFIVLYESKSIGKLYDNLLDLLGDDLIQDCPECGQTINIQENNILIYQVLSSGGYYL